MWPHTCPCHAPRWLVSRYAKPGAVVDPIGVRKAVRATLLDLFFGPAQTGVYSKYAASLGCGACKEGAAVVFTPTCSPTHEQVGAGDPVQVWHCHLCQSPILGIHHHEHAKCSLHSLQAPCKPGAIGASRSFVCAWGPGGAAGLLAAHVSLLLITRLPSRMQFNDDIFLPTSEPAGTIEATVRRLCNPLLLFKVLTFSLARTPGALCLQVVAPRSKL